MERSVAEVLHSAATYWENGQADVCRQELEALDRGAHSSETILLLARVLLTMNQFENAIGWLEENVLRHDDEDALAVHWILLGQAYASINDFVASDRALKRFETLDVPTAVIGEAAYVTAFSFYQRADYTAARKRLTKARDLAEDLVLVRVAALSGLLDQAEGKLADSYLVLLNSLTSLRSSRVKDMQLHASVTHSLAIAVAETAVGDPADVDAELSRIVWNASNTGVLVDTLRNVGLAYRRRGDTVRAMDRFVASADVAAGTAWSVGGYAECANAALEQGELLGAYAFADHACKIVERIERTAGWAAIRGQQRLGLLTLALALARLEQGTSAERYRRLYNDGLDGSTFGARDVRRSLLEQHVAGIISGALGDHDGSIAQLQDVQRRWAEVGCDARAIEAAADAYRGRSGHLRRATSLAEPASRRTVLSTRDEQILEQLLAGRSYADVADRYGLAIKTVRAITGRIFAKFDVTSRAELLVKLQGWKL